MISLLFSTATLLTGVLAIPTPSSDPIRTLPASWRFDIADLKGPGCPDLNRESGWKTRHNYGQNTVDGTEIYFNVFAYPYLKASIAEGETSASTWCETTLKYVELADYKEGAPTAANYRLRPHKNGTIIGALYDLDEGVKADWKFTYYAPGDKTVRIPDKTLFRPSPQFCSLSALHRANIYSHHRSSIASPSLVLSRTNTSPTTC